MLFNTFQLLIFSHADERHLIVSLIRSLENIIEIDRIDIFGVEKFNAKSQSITRFCETLEKHKWISFKLKGLIFESPITIEACISPVSPNWFNPKLKLGSSVWKGNLLSLQEHILHYQIADYPTTFDITIAN